MRLTRISAHSFRNLSPDPVFFGSGTTVIAGENAQGKTTLLEAVALVCGLAALPPAETVLLTTASEPSRWRLLPGAVLEMRDGRVAERPRAVND